MDEPRGAPSPSGRKATSHSEDRDQSLDKVSTTTRWRRSFQPVRRHRNGARRTNRFELARVVGAAGLLVTAVTHLNLYLGEQYREIPTIGPLFLLDIVAAAALGVGVLLFANWAVAAAGSVLAAGTLAAYLVALNGTLFGFHEPGISYSGGVAIGAEVVASALLGIVAWSSFSAGSPSSERSGDRPVNDGPSGDRPSGASSSRERS